MNLLPNAIVLRRMRRRDNSFLLASTRRFEGEQVVPDVQDYNSFEQSTLLKSFVQRIKRR
jgi:hypothetical protein